jgi:general secretion pathway protein D
VQKVPFLGDLPLVGGLFRYENKARGKTNLLVFLRPYVMRTSGATDRISQDRYGYIRGQQQGYVSPNIMMRSDNTPVLPPADAPGAPFVDPRANGPIPGPLPLPQTLPPPDGRPPVSGPAPAQAPAPGTAPASVAPAAPPARPLAPNAAPGDIGGASTSGLGG